MSLFEPESTVAAHYERGTVGDLLTFDSWPEESRRIARFAVATELRDSVERDVKEDARVDGRVEMEWEAEREYVKVAKTHDGIAEIAAKLRERAKSPETIALLDALDRLVADLPDKLPLNALAA